MEEKYAFQAKKMAFLLGFIAFIVSLFMLKTLLIDTGKQQSSSSFVALAAIIGVQLSIKAKRFLLIIARLAMPKV